MLPEPIDALERKHLQHLQHLQESRAKRALSEVDP